MSEMQVCREESEKLRTVLCREPELMKEVLREEKNLSE